MLVCLAARLAAADPLVAVVLVDEAARDEGYALELEDLVLYDALPVAVGEGEQVRIVDPAGERHPLDVAPGEAWEITGRQGEAWMSRLGDEVRTDVLLVRGNAGAVKSLAEALGAEVVVEGDQTWLVGHDILFEAPWVGSEGLERLDEVRLVRAHPDDVTTTRTEVPVRAPRPVLVRQPVRAEAPAVAAVAPVIAPEVPALAATKPVADPVPEPAAEPAKEPVAAREDWKSSLDPELYAGMYLCGMGGPLFLDPYGRFAHARGTGEWYVSAPGVVRLLVDGALRGRAAIEIDRHYCRAVW